MSMKLEWTLKSNGKFEAKPEEGVRITLHEVGFDIWKWFIYRYGIKIARGQTSYLSWAKEEVERVYKKEVR
jgi:hypothetical protein